MTEKITVIQKGNTRYTFKKEIVDRGNSSPLYRIETEQLLQSRTGSSMTYRYVGRTEGNEFYKRMMKEGFKRFENVRDVTWKI